VAATLLSLLIIALAACGSSTAQSGTTPSGTASGSWAQANYDYANTRDATQSTLSSHNVTQLGVAWTYKVSGVSAFGALATSPVVQNGTVYLQDLSSNVYAIDLQTGQLKWEKRYNAPNNGPNGPAVDEGKVFVASNEQTVAALDATTGKELWSKQIAPASTQGIDQQLAAYHGTLYVSTVPGPSAANFYTGGGMVPARHRSGHRHDLLGHGQSGSLPRDGAVPQRVEPARPQPLHRLGARPHGLGEVSLVPAGQTP